MTTIRVRGDRKIFTIIAALRYWQREGQMSSGQEMDIAGDFGRLAPLTTQEISILVNEVADTARGAKSSTGVLPMDFIRIMPLVHLAFAIDIALICISAVVVLWLSFKEPIFVGLAIAAIAAIRAYRMLQKSFDQERNHANYYLVGNWHHIFADTPGETSDLRIVVECSENSKVVAMDVLTKNGYKSASQTQMDDVTGSLLTANLEALYDPADWGLEMKKCLPAWARMQDLKRVLTMFPLTLRANLGSKIGKRTSTIP